MTVILPGSFKLKLIKVKAGSFDMGSRNGENSDDEKEHRVSLTRDFYLGRIEVTQAQREYAARCVKKNRRLIKQTYGFRGCEYFILKSIGFREFQVQRSREFLSQTIGEAE